MIIKMVWYTVCYTYGDGMICRVCGSVATCCLLNGGNAVIVYVQTWLGRLLGIVKMSVTMSAMVERMASTVFTFHNGMFFLFQSRGLLGCSNKSSLQRNR